MAKIERFRCRSGAVKVNLALSELRRFPSRGGDDAPSDPPGSCPVELAFSPACIQAAFDDPQSGRPAARPIADATFPSALDGTLGPKNMHCMSVHSQWVPDEWHEEPHRDELEAYADRVIDEYAAHAPNLNGSILARQVIKPYDMEHDLGLVGGNVYGGELAVDQIFHMRPSTRYADYRTPIAGLYNGSAGAHGGGGVSGIPGWKRPGRRLGTAVQAVDDPHDGQPSAGVATGSDTRERSRLQIRDANGLCRLVADILPTRRLVTLHHGESSLSIEAAQNLAPCSTFAHEAPQPLTSAA